MDGVGSATSGWCTDIIISGVSTGVAVKNNITKNLGESTPISIYLYVCVCVCVDMAVAVAVHTYTNIYINAQHAGEPRHVHNLLT